MFTLDDAEGRSRVHPTWRSTQELRDHASAIASQANDSRANFASMRSRLEALASQFRGQAAEAFNARSTEWDQSANRLLESLDALGSFLSTSAAKIEEFDAQLAWGLNQ